MNFRSTLIFLTLFMLSCELRQPKKNDATEEETESVEEDTEQRKSESKCIVSECSVPREQGGLDPDPEIVPRYPELEPLTSTVPIFVVNTSKDSIGDEKVKSTALVFGAENGTGNFTGHDSHDHFNITIKLRGQTSRSYAKKSYSIDIVDKEGNNSEASILGLPKEKDWVLYGPFADHTFFRNVLALELSRRTGEYAPRSKYINLYFNTEGRPEYGGVYLLMEKITRGKQRVDISKNPLHGESKGSI